MENVKWGLLIGATVLHLKQRKLLSGPYVTHIGKVDSVFEKDFLQMFGKGGFSVLSASCALRSQLQTMV